MTILNVNYRQFEEYHFVFAQMNAACCIGGQNKKNIIKKRLPMGSRMRG